MERKQQRFVIKFVWLREYRPCQIHQELFATLGSGAYSEDSVQYWVSRFESGGINCEEISRAGRPITDLAEAFRLFLQDDPFTNACMLSRHFDVCVTTVKDILACDLGLKEFTRRWMPHTLSGPQKVKRIEASTELLQILNDLETDYFDGIAQMTSHSFNICTNRRLCSRSRQVMSRQERDKKLVRRKLCLRFSSSIGSC
jgi:hypothetical protein